MAPKFDTLALVLMFTSLHVAINSALHIEIYPKVVTEQSSGPVKISCVMDHAASENVDACLIDLEKNGGNPMAFIRKGFNASFGANVPNLSSLQIAGNFDKDASKSFLKLTLLQPTNDDQGVYTCKLYYSDNLGFLRDTQASANFTVDNFDVHRMLKDFNDKMSIMEEELKSQDVKETTDTLAFAATLTKQVTLSSGAVVVFPNVVMNLGQVYNGSTGVFTAPVDGLFFFHVILATTSSGTWIVVDIMSNDKVLASIGVGDKEYHIQSSGSVLADLEKGGEVRVIKRGGGTLYYSGLSSTFTGYLIKRL